MVGRRSPDHSRRWKTPGRSCSPTTVGLVTDMGSILAHGSIVAREYGIPAVLGVGNGTVRIKHDQSITIDGDAGSVTLHEEGSTVGL